MYKVSLSSALKPCNLARTSHTFAAGKNFLRNLVSKSIQLLKAPRRLSLNHVNASPSRERGKRVSKITSLGMPGTMIPLVICKKVSRGS